MKPRLYVVTVFRPLEQPQCKPYQIYAYTRKEAIEQVQYWLDKSDPQDKKIMDARPLGPAEFLIDWWPQT